MNSITSPWHRRCWEWVNRDAAIPFKIGLVNFSLTAWG